MNIWCIAFMSGNLVDFWDLKVPTLGRIHTFLTVTMPCPRRGLSNFNEGRHACMKNSDVFRLCGLRLRLCKARAYRNSKLQCIPRNQLTSIFEGQPSKTRPFPIQTRVIWVLGIYHLRIPCYLCYIHWFFFGVVPQNLCTMIHKYDIYSSAFEMKLTHTHTFNLIWHRQ